MSQTGVGKTYWQRYKKPGDLLWLSTLIAHVFLMTWQEEILQKQILIANIRQILQRNPKCSAYYKGGGTLDLQTKNVLCRTYFVLPSPRHVSTRSRLNCRRDTTTSLQPTEPTGNNPSYEMYTHISLHLIGNFSSYFSWWLGLFCYLIRTENRI